MYTYVLPNFCAFYSPTTVLAQVIPIWLFPIPYLSSTAFGTLQPLYIPTIPSAGRSRRYRPPTFAHVHATVTTCGRSLNAFVRSVRRGDISFRVFLARLPAPVVPGCLLPQEKDCSRAFFVLCGSPTAHHLGTACMRTSLFLPALCVCILYYYLTTVHVNICMPR